MLRVQVIPYNFSHKHQHNPPNTEKPKRQWVEPTPIEELKRSVEYHVEQYNAKCDRSLYIHFRTNKRTQTERMVIFDIDHCNNMPNDVAEYKYFEEERGDTEGKYIYIIKVPLYQNPGVSLHSLRYIIYPELANRKLHICNRYFKIDLIKNISVIHKLLNQHNIKYQVLDMDANKAKSVYVCPVDYGDYWNMEC
jgi:hypothetical protein